MILVILVVILEDWGLNVSASQASRRVAEMGVSGPRARGREDSL